MIGTGNKIRDCFLNFQADILSIGTFPLGLFPLGLFRLGLFAIRLFPAGIFSIWTFSKAPRFPRTRSTISPKSSQAQDPSKVEIRYQENSVDAPPHAHPLELVPHPLEARRNARVLLKLKKTTKNGFQWTCFGAMSGLNLSAQCVIALKPLERQLRALKWSL